MDTWVIRSCRRHSRRQALAWGLGLAGLLAWGTQEAAYLKSLVTGPRAVAADEMAQLAQPDGSTRYYVGVTGARMVDTHIRLYSVRTQSGVTIDSTVKATYYGIELGDKFLIVKTEGEQMLHAEGELVERPAEFDQHFFRTREMQSIRSRFYPVLLDTTSYKVPGYWALGGAAGFLLLFAWLGRPAFRYARDAERHPVAMRVKRWGDAAQISAVIERELKEPGVFKQNTWTLTRSYAVQSGFFVFDLHRFYDLVWAYPHVTQHRTNFIPTGKTYRAELHFSDGSERISANKKRVEELLGFAAARAPWAVLGFSDDLKAEFKDQREQFIRAVQQRRPADGSASPAVAAAAPPRSDATPVFVVEVDLDEGKRQFVTVLEPATIGPGGLKGPAIMGALARPLERGETITAEIFTPNPAFLEFLHQFLGEYASKDPALRTEAKRVGNGWVYVMDQRTPTPGSQVPPEDIMGAFEVKNGEIVPGSWRANEKHTVLSANGFVRLDPKLHRILVKKLLG